MASLEQKIDIDYYQILAIPTNATPQLICQQYAPSHTATVKSPSKTTPLFTIPTLTRPIENSPKQQKPSMCFSIVPDPLRS